MILIRLMGGLGNQLFQYAFGRALSIKYNTELVLDQSLLLDKSESHEINTHRDYDLDIFKNLHFRWATEKEIFEFNGNSNANILKKINRKITNTFSPKYLMVQKQNTVNNTYFTIKGDTCFVGRWQSYCFFEEYETDVKNDFKLSCPEINNIEATLSHIQNTESVCLHVRRGDLITSPLYSKTIGALDIKYYTKALEYINEKVNTPHYFIFSEDVQWCKQNIKTNKPTTFVDSSLSGKKAEGHFYLMQQCKHFIIANSTYAWWTAYLAENKNKHIVYPNNWYKDEQLQNKEMCPEKWIAI